MTKKDEKKERYDALKKIRDEVVVLKRSPLYLFRAENSYLPVIGEGDHFAKIVFVGEGPGLNEAKTGRPFCGAAGKILDELLSGAGIERGDVYITNIIKDRPPKNRDPLPEEIKIYAPFLDRQIEIIKPKVIATLGRFSMEYIFTTYGLTDVLGPISKMHGKDFKTVINGREVIVLSLYHPAVVVYNNKMKPVLVEDFKRLKEFI